MENVNKKRTILSFVFAGLGLLGLLIVIFLNPISLGCLAIGEDEYYTLFQLIDFDESTQTIMLSMGLVILLFTFIVRFIMFALEGLMSVLNKEKAFKTVAKINKIFSIIMFIFDAIGCLILLIFGFVQLGIVGAYSLPLQLVVFGISLASMIVAIKLNQEPKAVEAK